MSQLYVGNLSYSTTEQELRSMFEQYGRVNAIRMATDQSTGRSRGFAFISMPSEDAEEALVSLNGKYLSGRTLVVNESREKSGGDKQAARRDALALLSLI